MTKTGLLMQTEIPDPEDKDNCTVLSQFVHLMIQELLAMAGLLAQPPSEFKRLLKELDKTQQFSMARLFLYGLAFDPNNDIREILNNSIVCKEHLPSNQKILQDLAQKNTENAADKLQALQVAHESQSADVASIVGLHNFKDGCQFENVKFTVIDILALVFMLEHNPCIRNIRLERAELDRASITEISSFLKSENSIEDLVLSSDAMTDIGLHTISSTIMASKTITKLDLSCSAVTDKGVKDLAQVLEIKSSLKSLRILFRGMTNAGVLFLAAKLKTNNTLEELWLLGSEITDDAVMELGQALSTNTSIMNLRVDSRALTDDGIVKFANSLAQNKSLVDMGLHSQCITDTGVKYFMKSMKDRRDLTNVALTGIYMTEDAVTAILDTMSANPNLTVGMWQPEVSDEVFQKLDTNPMIRFI